MLERTRSLRRTLGIHILMASLAAAGSGCVMMSKMSWRSASNPHLGSAESVTQGSALYATECASCHGVTGFGDGAAAKPLATPPTNLRAFIADRDEGFFASQVAYGKTGNPDMMPFVETLTTDQIWHVTNYVFSLGPVPAPSAGSAATSAK